MAQPRASQPRPLRALLASLTFIVFTSGAMLGQSHAQTRHAPRAADRKAGPIALHRLVPLQEAFRRDQGKVRLLVLVSPT